MADQAEPVVPDPTAGSPSPAPATTPTTPPAAPSSAPWAGSPWAERLDALPENLTRQQVHELWQGEVQPYVTRREQELGEWGQIQNDLQDEEASLGTFLTLAETTYGPEVAQVFADAILAHVQGQEGQQPAGEPADEDAQYAAWYEQQPPWVQRQEDLRRGGEEDENYESEVAQHAPDVIEAGAEHLFARYVLAMEGDVPAAKQLFDQEMGPTIAAARENPQLAQSLGLAFAPEQEEPTAPGAPTVLGSSGAQGAPVAPQEPHYATLDDAMEDFWQTVAPSQPGGF